MYKVGDHYDDWKKLKKLPSIVDESNLEKGDLLVFINSGHSTFNQGEILEYDSQYPSYKTYIRLVINGQKNANGHNTYYFAKLPINFTPTLMSTVKERFALLLKSEPEKTFRKAGITNGDDILTEEGRDIFLSWLLQKHGEEFKKEVVDKIIKEEK